MDEKQKKFIVSNIAKQAVLPTSAEQLQKSTGLPFLRSTELYQTPLAEALQNKDGVIILMVKDNPNYGHWTILIHYPEQKLVEYFDSFGDEMPEALQNYLTRELPVGYQVVYSRKVLQQKVKASQTCGRWVVMRYATKHVPLATFISHMAKKIPAPIRDLVIAKITQ